MFLSNSSYLKLRFGEEYQLDSLSTGSVFNLGLNFDWTDA